MLTSMTIIITLQALKFTSDDYLYICTEIFNQDYLTKTKKNLDEAIEAITKSADQRTAWEVITFSPAKPDPKAEPITASLNQHKLFLDEIAEQGWISTDQADNYIDTMQAVYGALSHCAEKKFKWSKSCKEYLKDFMVDDNSVLEKVRKYQSANQEKIRQMWADPNKPLDKVYPVDGKAWGQMREEQERLHEAESNLDESISISPDLKEEVNAKLLQKQPQEVLISPTVEEEVPSLMAENRVSKVKSPLNKRFMRKTEESYEFKPKKLSDTNSKFQRTSSRIGQIKPSNVAKAHQATGELSPVIDNNDNDSPSTPTQNGATVQKQPAHNQKNELIVADELPTKMREPKNNNKGRAKKFLDVADKVAPQINQPPQEQRAKRNPFDIRRDKNGYLIDTEDPFKEIYDNLEDEKPEVEFHHKNSTPGFKDKVLELKNDVVNFFEKHFKTKPKISPLNFGVLKPMDDPNDPKNSEEPKKVEQLSEIPEQTNDIDLPFKIEEKITIPTAPIIAETIAETKRKRRRVIVFIEHLNCQLCLKDEFLSLFIQRRNYGMSKF